MLIETIILAAVFVAFYVVFLVWYGAGASHCPRQKLMPCSLKYSDGRGSRNRLRQNRPSCSNSVNWQKAMMGGNTTWSTCSSSAKRPSIQKEVLRG